MPEARRIGDATISSMPTPTIEQRLAARRRPTSSGPVMFQSWRELLFIHWRLDPQIIQNSLPDGLTVDTFDGEAYIGVVPFFMRNIRPRGLPCIPGISNFLELNVRTYVHDHHGTPGVWFYSLDANQKLAVRIARTFFALPYFDATMSATIEDGCVDYYLQRRGTGEQHHCRYLYRPGASLKPAQPGTLSFFLVERYYLFSHRPKREQLYAGQVHHTPYPLIEAEVDQYSDAIIDLAGLPRPNRPPDHIIMSHGVDVDIFAIQPVPA